MPLPILCTNIYNINRQGWIIIYEWTDFAADDQEFIFTHVFIEIWDCRIFNHSYQEWSLLNGSFERLIQKLRLRNDLYYQKWLQTRVRDSTLVNSKKHISIWILWHIWWCYCFNRYQSKCSTKMTFHLFECKKNKTMSKLH